MGIVRFQKFFHILRTLYHPLLLRSSECLWKESRARLPVNTSFKLVLSNSWLCNAIRKNFTLFQQSIWEYYSTGLCFWSWGSAGNTFTSIKYELEQAAGFGVLFYFWTANLILSTKWNFGNQRAIHSGRGLILLGKIVRILISTSRAFLIFGNLKSIKVFIIVWQDFDII
jgi:hypothetical protein